MCSNGDAMIEGAKKTLLDKWAEEQSGIPMGMKPLCPVCGCARHPVEIVEDGDGMICSHCLIDREREQPDEASVEERWNDIKGQRNLLLEQWSWTLRRDSPLNSACQNAF